MSAVGSGPLDASPSQGGMSLYISLHLSTYFSESPDFALHFMQRFCTVAVGKCPKLCELSITKGISAYKCGEEVLTSSQESTPIHLQALTHTSSCLHIHAHMCVTLKCIHTHTYRLRSIPKIHTHSLTGTHMFTLT